MVLDEGWKKRVGGQGLLQLWLIPVARFSCSRIAAGGLRRGLECGRSLEAVGQEVARAGFSGSLVAEAGRTASLDERLLLSILGQLASRVPGSGQCVFPVDEAKVVACGEIG
jgi:hypothetical protein